MGCGAIVGVYGIVSYAAIQRTQEIGIRMALGASPRQVLGLIVGQGMRVVLIGVFVGLLAAWGLTRTMTHLLIGISPSDPIIYIGVSILLAFVAWLACWLPARRASRIDPMVALRYE
jgi:putative ABC transport system permease protein